MQTHLTWISLHSGWNVLWLPLLQGPWFLMRLQFFHDLKIEADFYYSVVGVHQQNWFKSLKYVSNILTTSNYLPGSNMMWWNFWNFKRAIYLKFCLHGFVSSICSHLQSLVFLQPFPICNICFVGRAFEVAALLLVNCMNCAGDWVNIDAFCILMMS